jgi:aspartyl-tRNA(Asn)/glutamyl-tRNA(Gln) amidotransferase subunit B
VDGEKKKIVLHHIHFEEDAGKLIHEGAFTRVDLNRCGVPLIEIVTEPDMRSAKEACAFLETLRAMMLFAGISDCKMQEGSLRCDVNVSVRPYGQKEYGVRAEMKNINSFSAVYAAIEYERKRQITIIESGGTVKRETLRWDDARGISYAMRSKEQADDYLYFPEPDIPMIELDDDYIESVRATLPELPKQRVQRYVNEYGLPEYDAAQITLSKRLSDFFDACVKLGAAPKTMSNWIMSDIRRVLNERQIEADDFDVSAEHMLKLLELVDQNTINRTTAAKVFEIMVDQKKDPGAIVAEKGMAQISDESAILQMCQDAVAAMPKAVDDYRAGNKKALTSLVGRVMKESKGKANPALVNKLLLELLL